MKMDQLMLNGIMELISANKLEKWFKERCKILQIEMGIPFTV